MSLLRVRDAARRDKIVSAIWQVEIGLDCLYCKDGNEDEDVADAAGQLLEEATRLRKQIIRALGDDAR